MKCRNKGVEPSWRGGVADRDAPLVQPDRFSFLYHPWGLHGGRGLMCSSAIDRVFLVPSSEVRGVVQSEVQPMHVQSGQPR
jgi:hypothetical protein